MNLWSLSITVPLHASPAFESALELFCQSVTYLTGGDDGDGQARISGVADGPPDRGALDLALTLAAIASNVAVPEVETARLEARDWLAENLAQFPPLTIGRFFVHGEHVTETPPPGSIGLRIDPGMAFGTGEHPSTEGVLMALSAMKHRPIRRAFDIGCGSGILAIAIARLFRCPVVALDIDAKAVTLTREHARLNGVASLVRAGVADGYRSALIRRAGKADLIVSNILARPLMRLALDLALHLAPCGAAVLAGFVARDVRAVAARHRAMGLRYQRAIPVANWRTLVMTAPPVA